MLVLYSLERSYAHVMDVKEALKDGQKQVRVLHP